MPSLRAPLEEDTERAHFLMKLAPRIRRLEADTVESLKKWMDRGLKQLKRRRNPAVVDGDQRLTDHTPSEDELLLILGHCMRAMALLGRGKEAESIFAGTTIT